MNDEEKCLKLLQFALGKNSVPSTSYLICTDNPNVYAEGRTCLVKEAEDSWRIYFNERGGVYDLSVHQSLFKACREFFCRLTKCPSPWDFRVEWEQSLNE